MKYLITWRIHKGKLHETLAQFSQVSAEREEEMMGHGIKLHGRWHDLVRGGGAAVIEAESAEALSSFALHWNRYMDLDIVPVVEDEAAKAIGSRIGSPT